MTRRYKVIFTERAKRDFESAFKWGQREWGNVLAYRWHREIKSRIMVSLSTMPLRHAMAPESEEYGGELRHMIVGRYRVLFEVDGKTVRVLHLRGSYVGNKSGDLGVDE